jgi:hypothetical protein
VQLTGTWLRRVDRETELQLGVGAGAARTELVLADEPPVYGAFPSALLRLDRRFPTRRADVDGRLTLGLGPHVDPFTGIITERAEGRLSARGFFGSLRLEGQGGAAVGLTRDAARQETLLQGSLAARSAFSRELSTEAIFNAAWTDRLAAPSAFGFQWAASLWLVYGRGGIL